MSQIKLGLCSVTNGSATVVGDTSTDWSGVSSGNIFTVSGSNVWYQVNGSATHVGGTHWELTLTGVYTGPTATLNNYVIHSSFTPIHGLPYPEQGDVNTAAIVKRSMLLIDDLLGTVGGSSAWGTITGLLSAQSDLIAALAQKMTLTGAENVGGQKTFTLVPDMPEVDLGTNLTTSTALTVGKCHRGTISSSKTVSFVGTPTPNASIQLKLLVSANCTLSVPTCKRVGAANLNLGSIDLPIGNHLFIWRYMAGEWLLMDSISTGRLHYSWTFDPRVVCQWSSPVYGLMTIGSEAPSGFYITEWRCTFDGDPAQEADLDLKYADSFLGRPGATVIDQLDTNTGVSQESTPANINSGNPIANGKVLYLEFGTNYTDVGRQILFEFWGYPATVFVAGGSVYPVSVSEIASAATVQGLPGTITATISETAGAASAQNFTGTIAASVSESSTATSTQDFSTHVAYEDDPTGRGSVNPLTSPGSDGLLGWSTGTFGDFVPMTMNSDQFSGGSSPQSSSAILTNAISADQGAKAIVTATFSYWGLQTRRQGTSDVRGYLLEILANTGNLELKTFDTATSHSTTTSLGVIPVTHGSGSGGVLDTGDSVEITSVGSLHSIYVNGVLETSITDSTYATGKPGIYSYAFYTFGKVFFRSIP